jgi:Leucine-rich repeat (LRR) protein
MAMASIDMGLEFNSSCNTSPSNSAGFELANCGLSEIQEGISDLSNLTKLDLANNVMQRLPSAITQLTETLAELNIQGNPNPQEEIQWLVEAMPRTRILQ